MCSFPPGHRGRRDGDGLGRTKAGVPRVWPLGRGRWERAPAGWRRDDDTRSAVRAAIFGCRVPFGGSRSGGGYPGSPFCAAGATIWWCIRATSRRSGSGTGRRGAVYEGCRRTVGGPSDGGVRAHRTRAARRRDGLRRPGPAPSGRGAADGRPRPRRRDRVEDAVQDAFVKAYASLGRFRAGLAVPAVDPPDRRQRGPQPAALGRADGPGSPCVSLRIAPRTARLRRPRRRSSPRSDEPRSSGRSPASASTIGSSSATATSSNSGRPRWPRRSASRGEP